ncbi:ABC transporter ATP-binding protein, partial [Neorhizobium galegae]
MTDILSITPRPSMAAGKTLLEVKNLVTEFPLRTGIFKAVNDISFSIEPGKTLCVVGESGSGKSVTARSILQIIDSPGRIASGSIILNRQDGSSVDLARLDPRSKAIRAVRGRDIAMIFQEPMSSLSPVHTVGDQITEVLRLHLNMSKAQARKEAAELLRQVEIPIRNR